MHTLKVAFVWHMHQPMYLWPDTPEAALPFARLHAYGSYTDLPWMLRRFEKTTVTFNLVPSLMEQIAGYARGEITDRALELCRRSPADLDADEQTYLLMHFSSAHPDNMSHLSPRYARLSHKRGLSRNAESIEAARREFTEADFLDLQVWFNLACCGYALRRDNETVRGLWAKDRSYTEDDKAALFTELEAAVEGLPAAYAQVRDEGRAELSTSPYYHAILPLLCDMRDATRRIARDDLPEALWRAPDDARRHLSRAREHHREVFGSEPGGLWPSEGAVSDAALALIEEAGFSWTASDEEVLANSLRPAGAARPAPAELYRAYRVGDGDLSIVFRDHFLSDRVGFVYRDWAPRDAAADFVGHLIGIASGLSAASQPPLVCVILDGENPWGAYPDGGEGLLTALYGAIEAEEMLETASVGEYIREFPPPTGLESVFPGSWIDHSCRTWIGGPEHRRAWRLLHDARQAVERAQPGEQADRARDYLMRAEGSDWFWWYSEFHHDEHDDVFDALFRANVAAVYTTLGEPEPEALGESIAVVGVGRLARQPAGYMEPVIDGRVTGYFEWQAAGVMRTSTLASAMHRSDCIVREIYFGFEAGRLCLRVDTAGRARAIMEDCDIRFTFPGEPDRDLILARPPRGGKGEVEVGGELAGAARGAVDSIVEACVRLEGLGVQPGGSLEFAVAIERGDRTLERWPQRGFLRLEVPTADALSSSWLV